jgi:anti-sigma B factor antagonist
MLEKELSYTVTDGAKEGVLILVLDGPFTLGNMFKLQSEMRSLTPPCLIMDLSAVPYVDSAGLGVIMNSFVSAQSHGRKLILTGVSDRIRALFEMTKVDGVLKISDSVPAAEALA